MSRTVDIQCLIDVQYASCGQQNDTRMDWTAKWETTILCEAVISILCESSWSGTNTATSASNCTQFEWEFYSDVKTTTGASIHKDFSWQCYSLVTECFCSMPENKMFFYLKYLISCVRKYFAFALYINTLHLLVHMYMKHSCSDSTSWHQCSPYTCLSNRKDRGNIKNVSLYKQSFLLCEIRNKRSNKITRECHGTDT